MNKELIKECFNSSANTYDSVADIQRLSSEKLIEMIGKKDVFSVLDIGCGTGNTSLKLYEKYPDAEYTFCDISERMVKVSSGKFPKEAKIICTDAEDFIFTERYDLAVANLSMQWFSDQIKFLEKIKNYCKTFAFSTLLNSSFERYRDLFEIPPKFNYPSAEELRNNSVKNYCIRKYTLEFENFFAVAKYFKKLGAHAISETKINSKNISEKIFLDYEVFFAVMDF